MNCQLELCRLTVNTECPADSDRILFTNNPCLTSSYYWKTWDDIKTCIGSSSSQRFGIEDNLGIQDRTVDMQSFFLHVSNLGDLSFSKGDNVIYIGAEAEITLNTNNIHLYAQSDENNSADIYTLGTGAALVGSRIIGGGEGQSNQISIGINSDNDSDNVVLLNATHTTGSDAKQSELQLSPNLVFFAFKNNTSNTFRTIFPFRDETTDYFLPITVNGNAADSTGDITFSVATLPWKAPLSCAFSSTGGAQHLGAGLTGFTQFTGSNLGYTIEANREYVISEDCTIQRLFIHTSGTQPASGTMVCTIRKNFSNTALVVTIPAGSSATDYSNVSDIVSLVAGDVITMQWVNNSVADSLDILSTGVTLVST